MRPLIRIVAVRLGVLLGSLLPVRERVLLATGHKSQLDGNLACLHAELQRRLPGAAVTKLAFQPGQGPLAHIRHLAREFAAAYQVRRSRVVIVDDYFFPVYPVRRRPGTTIIQTWHAAGAFKKFGLSLGDKTFGANEAITRRVRIHSNYTICLASSRATAEAYGEAFGQPLDRFVWDIGIPRADVLFQPDPSRLDGLRKRLGLPAGRRVVLYAPTFRGAKIRDARSPDALDLDLLERELGRDHVLLLRRHPFVHQRTRSARQGSNFVIDVSDEPDVNELMLISDVLLTDYSSVIFEFALLDRPIVFFAPDHDSYELERGFYFDYRTEGPGPVFETTREVANFLRAGEFDVSRLARFRERWFTVADGHATARFVDRLVLPQLAWTVRKQSEQ